MMTVGSEGSDRPVGHCAGQRRSDFRVARAFGEGAEECRPVLVHIEPWGPTRTVCGIHTYFGNGVEPNDWPCRPDTRQPTTASTVARDNETKE